MSGNGVTAFRSNIKLDLNDDKLGYYKLDRIESGRDDIKEHYFKLTAKGRKKLNESISKLKGYAEQGGYGATKWESVWLEDYKVEDEYETEILITRSKSEGWEMPVSLEQIREETSYQDMNVVNASWTVMRQESYMNGSWFRINIQIPIVDLIYLHESVIVRRIELGDYDNATD